jgi:hypothetical protein
MDGVTGFKVALMDAENMHISLKKLKGIYEKEKK